MSDLPFRCGQILECIDDDAHCWFLVEGFHYEVDHCQYGTDGKWYVFLLGMAHGWPVEQFRLKGADEPVLWATMPEKLRLFDMS